MNRRRLMSLEGLRGAIAVIVSLAAPAAGQVAKPPAARDAPAKAWTPPRLPWGDPDLQGIWPRTAMMGVPMERPRQFGERRFLTDEEFATGMFEYACHEGSYALRNILSAARAAEHAR